MCFNTEVYFRIFVIEYFQNRQQNGLEGNGGLGRAEEEGGGRREGGRVGYAMLFRFPIVFSLVVYQSNYLSPAPE